MLDKIPEVSKYYYSLHSGRTYQCIMINNNFAYLRDYIYMLRGNPSCKWTREVVFLPDFFKYFKLVNE